MDPPFPTPALPAFLFDDDQPAPAPPRGPGYRYALVPNNQTLSENIELPSLPESYGTGRLHLVARDPEWLHAAWDLSAVQLRGWNKVSPNGHLWLKVRQLNGKYAGKITDIALHAESRHWFILIGEDNCTCQASLGYPGKEGEWVEVAASNPATTPRRGATSEFRGLFVTKEVAPERESAPRAAQEEPQSIAPLKTEADKPVDAPNTESVILRASASSETKEISVPEPNLHRPAPISEVDRMLDSWWEETLSQGNASLAGLLAAPGWSPAQAEALASLLRIDEEKRVWLGSMEITRELMTRHAEESPEGASSVQLAEGNEATMAESSQSGPQGAGPKGRSFWFKVNAELVIYGSVASGAKVRIGSRDLNLRTDGTFSQRFILPDGSYTLPIEAESGDGVETRFATLHFQRESQYGGEVNPHPQDSTLKPPAVENMENAQ